MKKLKFRLKHGTPLSFEHNDKEYIIRILDANEIEALKDFRMPADEVINVRKTDSKSNTTTDYFIFKAFGRRKSNFFRLGKDELIRFKQEPCSRWDFQVTIFSSRLDDCSDYALFISEKTENGSKTSSFGIKSTTDPKYDGTISSKDLFKFDNGDFTINNSSIENMVIYEYYEQTVAKMIALSRSTPFEMQTYSVIPHTIQGCTADAFASSTRSERKYFKGNYVNEFAKEPPKFIEDFLARFNGRYSAITLDCRIIGEFKTQRIDCYIFEKDETCTHQIRHSDGLQFLHFTDYIYHVRYEAGSFEKRSTIKVFKNSTEILKLEVAYQANFNSRLEGLYTDTKEKIIEAMTELK